VREKHNYGDFFKEGSHPSIRRQTNQSQWNNRLKSKVSSRFNWLFYSPLQMPILSSSEVDYILDRIRGETKQ
jgi:hypothetical protein